MSAYGPPVDKLLALGEVKMGEPWRYYGTLEIKREHVPELIRLMSDLKLNLGDSDSPEVWAPLHAWRALAQLHAVEAARPYLDLMDALEREDADDWVREEAPEFFARLGPAAVPVLAEYLAAEERDTYVRWAVADSLGRIAQKHPQTRADVIGLLTRQVERTARTGPELSGGLVGVLLDLKAVEAATAIERAFATGLVDPSIAGDWPDVADELGVDPGPVAAEVGEGDLGPLIVLPPIIEPLPRHAKQKARAKRKIAKASRKRNRKKKR